MGAYDDAALDYLGEGWLPIPIRGKSMPVKGVTGYEGSVTVEKVAGWLNDDLNQRAIDGRGVGIDNIGIRHQLTLAIDVDQGYGSKGGVAELAKYAEKMGLPPLPGTISSTARGDDSPSRQYIYRVESDERLRTKPCNSVELCNWHHRFTACWPSIHPNGNVYTWYLPGDPGVPPTWGGPIDGVPELDHAAYLPAEWHRAFLGSVANADKNATVIDLAELFATFPKGEPDGLVRHLITKWSDQANHVGHDEFKNAAINAIMLGRDGHPGVADLFRTLVDRFTAYLNVERPDAADREVRSLIDACCTIAQQKPLESPAEATDEELNTFLATYTRYLRPDKLGRRVSWLMNDEPARMPWHARCMTEDALAGHYPADRVARALADGYRHHGGTDPAGPRQLLSIALGAILNVKVTA